MGQREQPLIQQGIFEKERNLKHDHQTKIKLISIYNEELDNLPTLEQQFDLGLVCDMILDVFRFKQREIVKVDAVVADHKTSIKKNLPFSIKNLLMHIKNQDH